MTQRTFPTRPPELEQLYQLTRLVNIVCLTTKEYKARRQGLSYVLTKLETPHPEDWFFLIEAFGEAERRDLKPYTEIGFKAAKKGFKPSGRKN